MYRQNEICPPYTIGRMDSSAGKLPVPAANVITSGTNKMSTSPPVSDTPCNGCASDQYRKLTTPAISNTDAQPATWRPRSVSCHLLTAAATSAPAVNCMTMRGIQLQGV